jgi:hypothetical protein
MYGVKLVMDGTGHSCSNTCTLKGFQHCRDQWKLLLKITQLSFPVINLKHDITGFNYQKDVRHKLKALN